MVYVAFLELLANAQQAMEEEQKQSRLSRLNSSSFRRKGSTGKIDNWLPRVVDMIKPYKVNRIKV